jgi:hypothetical protein|tara:strand:- start:463 stop:711 length:249 start_codon:yes stop_codon:yes gene_type:complete
MEVIVKMSYDLKNTSIGAYADIGSSNPRGSYLHPSVDKFAFRINDTGVGAYDRKNSTSSGISYEVPSNERHTIEAKVEGATH